MPENSESNLSELFIKSFRGKSRVSEINWYKNFSLKEDPFIKTEKKIEINYASLVEAQVSELYDNEAEKLVNEIGTFLNTKKPKIINLVGPFGSGRTLLIKRVLKAIIRAIEEYKIEIDFDNTFLYLEEVPQLKKGSSNLLKSLCIIIDNFAFEQLSILKQSFSNWLGLLILIWDTSSWTFFKQTQKDDMTYFLTGSEDLVEILIPMEKPDKITNLIKRLIDESLKEGTIDSESIIASQTIQETAELCLNPSLTRKILRNLFIIAVERKSAIARLEYLWDLDEFSMLEKWKQISDEKLLLMASTIVYLNQLNQTRGVTVSEIQEFFSQINLEMSQPTISRRINDLFEIGLISKEEPENIERIQQIRKIQKKGKIIQYIPHTYLPFLLYLGERKEKRSQLTLGDVCTINSGISIKDELLLTQEEVEKANIEDGAVIEVFINDFDEINPYEYRKMFYLFPFKLISEKWELEDDATVRNAIKYIKRVFGFENTDEFEEIYDLPKYLKKQHSKKKIIYPSIRTTQKKRDINQIIDESQLAEKELTMITTQDEFLHYFEFVFALLGSVYGRCLRQIHKGGSPNKLKKFPLPDYDENSREGKNLKKIAKRLWKLTQDKISISKKARNDEIELLWRELDSLILKIYNLPEEKQRIYTQFAWKGAY